jgi:hypothetical protein
MSYNTPKYFTPKYFSKYFQVQIGLVFSGGQVAYASLRYFENTVNGRVVVDLALQPALLTDIVSGIVFDSRVINMQFDDSVQEQSFIDSITRMTIDSTTPITTNDKVTVRNRISSSARRK